LGFQASPENAEGASEDIWDIGSGRKKVLVCRTDEEAEMARSVFENLYISAFGTRRTRDPLSYQLEN
jgi:hypothetical protein